MKRKKLSSLRTQRMKLQSCLDKSQKKPREKTGYEIAIRIMAEEHYKKKKAQENAEDMNLENALVEQLVYTSPGSSGYTSSPARTLPFDIAFGTFLQWW